MTRERIHTFKKALNMNRNDTRENEGASPTKYSGAEDVTERLPKE